MISKWEDLYFDIQKVFTVDIENKRRGLRVPNTRVSSSEGGVSIVNLECLIPILGTLNFRLMFNPSIIVIPAVYDHHGISLHGMNTTGYRSANCENRNQAIWGNSCIVDIEINTWSRSFVDLQINLIFIRYSAKRQSDIQSEASEFCVQPIKEQRNYGDPKSRDWAVST